MASNTKLLLLLKVLYCAKLVSVTLNPTVKIQACSAVLKHAQLCKSALCDDVTKGTVTCLSHVGEVKRKYAFISMGDYKQGAKHAVFEILVGGGLEGVAMVP